MTQTNTFSTSDVAKVLEEMIEAKTALKNGLSDLKVITTQEQNPDVLTAIRALFGDNAIKDGKAYITFDMLSECMTVIRKAGKTKAKELIV